MYLFFFKTLIYLACLFLCPFGYSELIGKSYSHVDCFKKPLDHKLVEILNLEGGIFIEVGANDGVTQSNTKLLEEDYGWTGILIEPSKNLHQILCANRPFSRCFQCALGSFEQNNTFVYGDFSGSLMSSVGGKRLHSSASERVLVRSLQSILDQLQISHVNFFSLDTEGYELNILKGIDFKRTSFDYMLIEIYLSEFDEIVNLLSQNGYVLSENFTNYNHLTNPGWDGTCNDFLFKRND